MVSSSSGNYTTSKNSLTVTTPITVPTNKVLEGTTIAGKVGTMPDMATRNPNGIGVGRSVALQYWTGGGTSIFLKPQKGYYDGVDTWTYYNEPNLISNNIKAGSSIFGVNGSFTSDATATADQIASGATAYVNGNKIIGTMKTSTTTIGAELGSTRIVIYRGSPEETYLGGTNELIDSYTFPGVSGTAVVQFCFYSNSSAAYIYWDLKVNGVSVEKNYRYGFGTDSKSARINVSPGTVVELWGYTSRGYNGYIYMSPMAISIGSVTF